MTRPRQHAWAGFIALLATSLAIGIAEGRCESVNVVKPTLIYGGLSVADLASTRYAIQQPGVQERNAFMRDDAAAKSLALAAGFTAADIALQKHGKKGQARALRIVYAAWRVSAVVINVKNARKR